MEKLHLKGQSSEDLYQSKDSEKVWNSPSVTIIDKLFPDCRETHS